MSPDSDELTVDDLRKAWVAYRLDYERFGDEFAGIGRESLEAEFDAVVVRRVADVVADRKRLCSEPSCIKSVEHPQDRHLDGDGRR